MTPVAPGGSWLAARRGRPDRHPRRPRAARLVLTAALVAVFTLAPAAALAYDPPTLTGELTDVTGVLSAAQRTTVQAALDAVATDTGHRLYVVYIGKFTGGGSPKAWTTTTARQSGLEPSDFLLAIAVDSRRYWLAPTQTATVTADEADAVRAAVQDDLRHDEWAKAAIAAADGLRAAAANGSSDADSSGGLGAAAGGVLVALLGLVAALIVVVVAAHGRGRRRAARALTPAPTPASATDASPQP